MNKKLRESGSLYEQRKHRISLDEEYQASVEALRNKSRISFLKILFYLFILSGFGIIFYFSYPAVQQYISIKKNIEEIEKKELVKKVSIQPPLPSHGLAVKLLIKNSRRAMKTLNNVQKLSLPLSEQINSLRQSLSKLPYFIPLQVELAKKYYENAQIEEARELLHTVLNIAPNNMEAWLIFAKISLLHNDFTSAEQSALWMLENHAESQEVYKILAKAYLHTKEFNLAITYLQKIIENDELDFSAQNNLGVAYTRIKQYDKAINIFENLLLRDDINSISYYNLAICYALTEQSENAVKTMTQAANLFGKPIVWKWVEQSEFDKVRSTRIFQQFSRQIINFPVQVEEKAKPVKNNIQFHEISESAEEIHEPDSILIDDENKISDAILLPPP